jgi:ribosome biogenesis GTPase / thiamine phosphate phosphatase
MNLTGEVLFGINTIYAVQVGDSEVRCRIKGKVLASARRSYNPIAAGDIVEIEPDPLTPGTGKIVSLRERRTSLSRWNKKGRAPQIIAANAELAVCVTSPQSPPFRPRFIDRLIVAAESGGIRPVILLNKADLGCPDDTRERLDFYQSLGYTVLSCSALTGEGLPALRELLEGKTAVLVGQSGVGKSSILNALSPGASQRVGDISRKHDRGNHTTNFAVLLRLPGGFRVIDSPGIRELELSDVLAEELPFHFREFTPFLPSCQYAVCLHADEPGCAVRLAVDRGEIHSDRYESYLRTLAELQDTRRQRTDG